MVTTAHRPVHVLPRRPMRYALLGPAALMFMIQATAFGQQQADPDFKIIVEKPAYTKNKPRVLFDEAHHNFHTTEGRYKPFATLVRSDGYEITPNRKPFSRKLLDGYDILISANALGAARLGDTDAYKPAFTDAECDAVRDWVRAGGSLLLIADHAPIGAANMNMAERFGVEMRNGATLDPKHAAPGERASFLLFSRENKLLADHAITRGRNARETVRRVMTFTGQSLSVPNDAVPLLKLADSAVDRLTSTTRPATRREVSAAGRAQGLAMQFGQGRVVILGEAAMLSAQRAVRGDKVFKMGMNRENIDNRRFALNIMHWLSGLLDAK